MPATPRVIYFDLGNVLLTFERQTVFRQMGEVLGVPPEIVQQIYTEEDLEQKFESGLITELEHYEVYCRRTGTRPDPAVLAMAGSDIFTLNYRVVAILTQLSNTGRKLGLLSNISETHWNFCLPRYRILTDVFDFHCLSYQSKAMKPEAKIYLSAAEIAGCRLEEIFFVDDRQENVDGAKAVGIDAVLFTTAEKLADDLDARGVHFNY